MVVASSFLPLRPGEGRAEGLVLPAEVIPLNLDPSVLVVLGGEVLIELSEVGDHAPEA